MKDIIGWIIGIAVIWFIISAIAGIGKYEGESAEYWFNAYDEASGQVEELQSKVEGLQTALQEANDNIEEADRNIRNAKLWTGSSYDDMEFALDSLRSVDTVNEP